MPGSAPLTAYRFLLRAFPASYRAAHGDDMLRLFRDERLARSGRPLAIAALWSRAVFDALWHGSLERFGIRRAVTDSAPRSAVSQRSATASWLSGLSKDISWSARRLRATPGFTIVAALTLALGIGATSAIFSVVNGVLLRPLPFADPSRVVGLFQVWEGKRDVFTAPNFIDVESRAKSFSAAAAYDAGARTLTNAGDPVRVVSVSVSAGFFDATLTPPLLGRTLTRADNEPGHTGVVVLSHALWTSRFGGDESVVGRTITLDGKATQVVGVMPDGFVWPLQAECWQPSAYTKQYTKDSRGAWNYDVIARLKPGVTVGQAAAEMAAIGLQLEKEYPDMDAKVGMTAFPILDDLLGETKHSLLVLLGAVGFVLLIACVNVANLLLARAASREGEVAVRVALGAGRWRLIRQALVESFMLALLGGVAGVLLAYGVLRAVRALQPPGIPRLSTVAIDMNMIAFTAGVSVLTGLLFGVAPALQTSARSLADMLRERGRSALGGVRGRTTRYVLIVAEMALAVLLLTGAGLLIRSFAHLARVSPGFTVGQAATFRVGLPAGTYKDDAAIVGFFDRARAELAAVPGAADVGVVLLVPPTQPQFNLSFEVAGRPPLKPNDQPTLEIRVADPEYFRVMNIATTRGRLYTSADRANTPGVVVLTESAVRRHFPGEDPIGKHLKIGWNRDGHVVEGDVIGVVADVKSFGLDQEAPPQVYLPLAQTPMNSMAFVVRTRVPPESMFGQIRDAIKRVDANLPIARIETLEAHVNNTVGERRFYMLLLALFAAIALLLAGIGIFGVLSFLVAQRTREIGIRMALGAGRASVVRTIVTQALMLASSGIAIGTVTGLALTTLMASMLFDLSPTDPLTFAAVDAGLFIVASLAAWLPTRRASRVNPVIALREG